MVNYHELIEGKVYIGGENVLLDALRMRPAKKIQFKQRYRR